MFARSDFAGAFLSPATGPPWRWSWSPTGPTCSPRRNPRRFQLPAGFAQTRSKRKLRCHGTLWGPLLGVLHEECPPRMMAFISFPLVVGLEVRGGFPVVFHEPSARTTHFSSGPKSPNLLLTPKFDFPKSIKSRNSASETRGSIQTTNPNHQMRGTWYLSHAKTSRGNICKASSKNHGPRHKDRKHQAAPASTGRPLSKHILKQMEEYQTFPRPRATALWSIRWVGAFN